MTAGTVGGCFRCGGSGQGAGCACACEGAAAAGGSGLGSGTAGPAELDAPPSFDPEDPPHAGAPAAFATEGGAGGGVVEAARVAGNDACSIKTNERRAPGGNCWRKGAKSSPSSNAARITAKAASRSAGEKDMARPGGDATECLVTEKATSSRDSCRHDESLMSMRTRVCSTTNTASLGKFVFSVVWFPRSHTECRAAAVAALRAQDVTGEAF